MSYLGYHQPVRVENTMQSTYQRISPSSHSMANSWKSSLNVPLGRKKSDPIKYREDDSDGDANLIRVAALSALGEA